MTNTNTPRISIHDIAARDAQLGDVVVDGPLAGEVLVVASEVLDGWITITTPDGPEVLLGCDRMTVTRPRA